MPAEHVLGAFDQKLPQHLVACFGDSQLRMTVPRIEHPGDKPVYAPTSRLLANRPDSRWSVYTPET